MVRFFRLFSFVAIGFGACVGFCQNSVLNEDIAMIQDTMIASTKQVLQFEEGNLVSNIIEISKIKDANSSSEMSCWFLRKNNEPKSVNLPPQKSLKFDFFRLQDQHKITSRTERIAQGTQEQLTVKYNIPITNSNVLVALECKLRMVDNLVSGRDRFKNYPGTISSLQKFLDIDLAFLKIKGQSTSSQSKQH